MTHSANGFTSDGRPIIVRCCVCKRIKVRGEFVRAPIPRGFVASDTYCEECYEEFELGLEAAANAARFQMPVEGEACRG